MLSRTLEEEEHVLTDWPSQEVGENTMPPDVPRYRVESDGYDARRSGMRREVHRAQTQEDREIGLPDEQTIWPESGRPQSYMRRVSFRKAQRRADLHRLECLDSSGGDLHRLECFDSSGGGGAERSLAQAEAQERSQLQSDVSAC